MKRRLDRLSADSPVFAVEVPNIVVIVTRARDEGDAISRAEMLARSFYRLEQRGMAGESTICRPADDDETASYLAAEDSWCGDASLAAVFFELT